MGKSLNKINSEFNSIIIVTATNLVQIIDF